MQEQESSQSLRRCDTIKAMQIWADLHTHTRFSHGRGGIEDNVKFAIEKGLKVLAITDHGPSVFWIGMPFKKKSSIIFGELERCTKAYPEIELLLGVEANIIDTDGTLDVSEEILEKLDFLVIGLHPWVFSKGLRPKLYLSLFNTLTRLGLFPRGLSKEVNTRALTNAIERYPVDLVSHPGSFFSVDMVSLVKISLLKGTLLEINDYHALKAGRQLEIAIEEGAFFALNSDAHTPEDVGNTEQAVRVARSLGLSEDLIFNTGKFDDKKKAWLHQRKKNKKLKDRILPGKLMPWGK